MLGFVKKRDDTWEDAYRRMKQKLSKTMDRFKIKIWSDELATRKQKLHERVTKTSTNPLVTRNFNWNPKTSSDSKLDVNLYKSRGRPRTTWCQYVNKEI